LTDAQQQVHHHHHHHFHHHFHNKNKYDAPGIQQQQLHQTSPQQLEETLFSGPLISAENTPILASSLPMAGFVPENASLKSSDIIIQDFNMGMDVTEDETAAGLFDGSQIGQLDGMKFVDSEFAEGVSGRFDMSASDYER